MLAGAALGIVSSVVVQKKLHKTEDLEIGHIALATSMATASSRLPDILEPATSPNHRGFFHSVLFGIILGFLGAELWQNLKERREERIRAGGNALHREEIVLGLFLIVIFAFLLHLMMDSLTKRGLPLA